MCAKLYKLQLRDTNNLDIESLYSEINSPICSKEIELLLSQYQKENDIELKSIKRLKSHLDPSKENTYEYDYLDFGWMYNQS